MHYQLYTDYTLAFHKYLSKKGLWKAKASVLKEFKDELQMGKHLRMSTRFYFKLHLSTAHKVHPGGEAGTVGHSMHPNLAHKIRELVSENITGPDVVWNSMLRKKCLEVVQVIRNQEGQIKDKSTGFAKPHHKSSQCKYCGDDQESLKGKN